MQSFYLTDAQAEIVVIEDGLHPMTLGLPVAGDPTSLGDHVDPLHRAAAQSPQSPEAYQEYLASRPRPEPQPEPTVQEKLNSLGITIADLKAELGIA